MLMQKLCRPTNIIATATTFLFHYSHSTCPSAKCHIDISAQCLWMHYRSAVDEAEGLWLPKADLNFAHLWAMPDGKNRLCQL